MPSSCCSSILNSGEEEPRPELLKSQPADHNAPFSPQGCSWSPFAGWTKQEPAPNTSTWGQWQPGSFRLHSPYLPCLSCGYHAGSPRGYSQECTARWLLPSPPQPSHIWSQPSPSIWFGTAAVVRASQEALRLLTPCHPSPQKPKCTPLPSHPLSLYFPPHPTKEEDSP